ncbi:hypothetical protein ROS62_15365 [Streptomyces sp. DSM 41972]|uniref:Integral membrane protein n=1 Tax=Streptomyces althioticus subsp. attaecolombicae TaxID=3075534 RepID=A0ABU3HZT7_9ACTN|nr:hypothetical protein [Streptomyces sp. DSM 41972]SCD29207.1 hypothetical protein GA0115238_100235 [Streptomyces sp. di50b]SCD91377.1 hypothetical protein GA0115245_116435 [Streptomyces sp. di188]
MMADVYGQNVAGEEKANPRTMLLVGRITMVLVGRITMVLATAAAVAFAGLQLNILGLLVFVGALWGALVFPVLASFYWDKVSGKAFTTSVLAALAVFLPVRFSWIPVDGAFGIVVDVLAVLGVGVVLGLMVFGFSGVRAAKVVGVAAVVVSAPFALGSLHEYATLSGSLVAYSVSTVVCWAMSVRRREGFDFSLIARRTGDFGQGPQAAQAPAPPDAPDAPEPAGTTHP